MDILKSMETLQRVIELGSYTRAASDLQITPAMVSKRILALEKQLAAKLLNRNSHAISLTSVGAEYYRESVLIVAKVKEVHSKIADRQNIASGDLKIICSKTFGERVLSRAVSDFSKLHPEVRVNLVLRDMSVKIENLITEGFDLLVRTREHENTLDASLVMRKIVILPRILVASPKYLEMAGLPLSPDDLAQRNCLNPNGKNSENWLFTKDRKSYDVRVSGYPLANSSAVIRAACESGLGIARLSHYTVDDLLLEQKLSIILPTYQIAPRALFVFYNKTKYVPSRLRAFVDFLSTWIRRYDSVDTRYENNKKDKK